MPRIMAFDYGSKRTGVAVTDPLQLIATGLQTVESGRIIDFLKKYLATENIEKFIIGEPKRLNNEPSQSTEQVKMFIRLLDKHFPDIPKITIDERFTSKMASAAISKSGMSKRKRQNKALIDQTSAVILLQDYMQMRDNFSL
jgi:putative Holliday junction resolvase